LMSATGMLVMASANDLVAALGALGFVEQNPTTRRYAVSPEIFRFLHLISTEFGPNSAVKPLLRTQARKLGATIVIHALCRRTTYAPFASGPKAHAFGAPTPGGDFAFATGVGGRWGNRCLQGQRGTSIGGLYVAA